MALGARQPVRPGWLEPSIADGGTRYSAHDIPGLRLRRGVRRSRTVRRRPCAGPWSGCSAAVKALVVTHHALAGWPAWEGWAEALAAVPLRTRDACVGGLAVVRAPAHEPHGSRRGARSPGLYRGPPLPAHRRAVLLPGLRGRGRPLLRTDASMDAELFISTYEHVVVGEAEAPDCRDHPPASDLIAWATVANGARSSTSSPGTRPPPSRSHAYRRLIANAVAWVASPEAHRWAAANPKPIDVE